MFYKFQSTIQVFVAFVINNSIIAVGFIIKTGRGKRYLFSLTHTKRQLQIGQKNWT